LDPFHTVDEQTIWSALERVGLKPYIQSLSGKLGFIILQNGENFSQGQVIFQIFLIFSGN
jgi:ABC-type multidrug transport system fused ATPase/permease subunit